MDTGTKLSEEEEYASQSKHLLQFSEIPTIDRAWCFPSANGKGSQGMFVITQPSLMANKKRKSLLSTHIVKESDGSVKFHWAPFPTELTGVSAIVPSPSGTKLLVVRNPEGDSPIRLEIWGSCEMKKEFVVLRSVHGSLYTDGWFEGISWSSDETLVAYIAEEPDSVKPKFNSFGYVKDGTSDKNGGSWC